jgi:hypothetical protein
MANHNGARDGAGPDSGTMRRRRAPGGARPAGHVASPYSPLDRLRAILGVCGEHPILTLVSLLVVAVVVLVTVDEMERVFSANSPSSILRSTGSWFLFNGDGQLSAIGIVLTVVVAIAWRMSNRAEATPTPDQLEEIRRFVTGHFASYIARGLVAEGVPPERVAVARDPAWRKIYLQHLKLHNQLYALRTDVALDVFASSIDDAVRAHLVADQEAGQQADPLVAPETSG